MSIEIVNEQLIEVHFVTNKQVKVIKVIGVNLIVLVYEMIQIIIKEQILVYLEITINVDV